MIEKLFDIITKGQFPSSIKEELVTEFPLSHPEFLDCIEDWGIEQKIEIFDPRNLIHVEDYDKKIIIRRIQCRYPIFKKGIDPKSIPKYYLVYTKNIEVLKEYTFEEWDKGLIWKD
jgi:hypothetical protein